MANLLLFLSFLSLAALFTAPGIDMAMRVRLGFAVGLLAASIIYWAKKQGRPLSALEYLSSIKVNLRRETISFCLLATCGVCLSFLPQNGLSVEWSGSNRQIIKTFGTSGESFQLRPSQLEDGALWMNAEMLRCSGWFENKNPAAGLVFYANHGDARWMLNGKRIASIQNDDSNRYVYIPTELAPGAHKLVFESSAVTPPTHMYAATVEKQDGVPVLLSPIYSRPLSLSVGFRSLFTVLALLFCYLAVWGWLPRLNVVLKNMQRLRLAKPIGFLILICLAGYFCIKHLDIPQFLIGPASYEADEAAFGVMAQRLAQGELPPLFHYGQSYQGTLEAYPLALLVSTFGLGSIHWLSVVFCIVFILTVLLCAYRLGSLPLAVFSLIVLLLSGSHFYWIAAKTWFGYSFSLACGGVMMWAALDCWQKRRLRPALALLWGTAAGASLYELPISAPFVAASGVLILMGIFRTPSPSAKPSHSYASLVLAAVACLIFLTPYLPASKSSDAAQFLAQGRDLPTARVENEAPLIDRFLGECLPVLLGARTPFDQQHDTSSVFLPYFAPLLFFASLFILPLGATASISLLSCHFLRKILAGFGFFTILLVSYSPFGVWPWYALALYWVLPFSMYWLFQCVWRVSPGLLVIIAGMFFLSMWSASNYDSARLNNPSSLSLDGVVLNTDFDELIDLAKQHDIQSFICESGFDSTPINAGRDWIGECLTFASNGSLNSIDRLSRRFPSLAYENIRSQRVGYVFQENFYYNNPSLEAVERYAPLTMKSLQTLFGESGLGYQGFLLDGYRVFIPGLSHRTMNKPSWTVDSNNPVFLDAAFDNNISVRGYGRRTYWSSGEIPSDGGWIQIELAEFKPISRMLLFHGTKKLDYLHENTMRVRNRQGEWLDAGSLSYKPDMRSSVLILNEAVECDAVRIEFSRPQDGSWLTIFEMWMF
ncbi:MAG: hypothetical protein P9L94_06505 [Candidatus Hinthialibacter antarcticus]|nr:hypothetical protein [Candidatus Hinthialibacter antarcticus]